MSDKWTFINICLICSYPHIHCGILLWFCTTNLVYIFTFSLYWVKRRGEKIRVKENDLSLYLFYCREKKSTVCFVVCFGKITLWHSHISFYFNILSPGWRASKMWVGVLNLQPTSPSLQVCEWNSNPIFFHFKWEVCVRYFTEFLSDLKNIKMYEIIKI